MRDLSPINRQLKRRRRCRKAQRLFLRGRASPAEIFFNNTHLLSHLILSSGERAVAPVFFNTDRATPLTFKTVEKLNLDPDLSLYQQRPQHQNPAHQHSRRPGPQDLVNFWATYRITTGSLENLGFGLGGNAASEHRVVDHSVVGVFDLPGYTMLNASVFYNPDKFRLSLNVNNLTNEKYYIGYWTVNPQKPINFVMSMAYRF